MSDTTHNQSTDPVDTHDPAGMAQWLRERRDAALEFYKLDSEAQQRHFLQRWQQHVLPHLAFRFGQAATMVEQLSARVKWLEEWKDACEDTIARLNKKALHPDVRVPLPPDVLVDASPDRVHTESGPARAGRSVKVDVGADHAG